MTNEPVNQQIRPTTEAANPSPNSLADLVDRLAADQTLRTSRRRALISAVRRFCATIGREAQAVPAEPASVRAAIARVRPAQHSITPKTWTNIKTGLLAALRYGADDARRAPLLPAWRALAQHLPDKRLRNGLSRFTGYCSARMLTPETVDDAVMDDFRAWACAP